MAGWQDAPEVGTATPAWQQAPELGVGDYASDVAQAGATGLERGVLGPIGSLAGAVNALKGVHSDNGRIFWGDADPSGAQPTADPMARYTMPDYARRQAPPGAEFYPPALPAQPYEAKTAPGRVAQTLGELAPGAAAVAATGGGGLVPNLMRYAAIPAVGTEAAGQVLDRIAPGMAPAARTWGPLAFGGVAGLTDVGGARLAAASGPGRAQTALDDILANSGLTPQEIQARLAAHPENWIADVVPGGRQALAGITSQSGPGKAIGLDAIRNRADAMPGLAGDAVDATLGLPVSALTHREGLAQTARDEARAGFAAALTGIGPVDPSPTIRLIDRTLGPSFQDGRVQAGISVLPWQAQLQDIRQRLTGPIIPNQPGVTAVTTDANQLHQIQSDLRKIGTSLSSSADGLQRYAAGPVGQIRQSLVDQIDAASGGRFRAAQQQFADDQAVREAFDKGYQFDQNRRGPAGIEEDSPAAWNRWMNGAADPQRPWLDPATPAEREALQTGVRSRVEQQMGSIQNAIRQGRAPTDIPFNREKLAIVFGPDVADELATRYEQLRGQAATHNVAGATGSMTAERLAGQQMTGVRPEAAPAGKIAAAGSWPILGGVPLAVGLHEPNMAIASALMGGAAGGGRWLANRVGRAQELGRNEELARALTMPGPGNQTLIDMSTERATQPGPTRLALARALAANANTADETRPWQYQLAAPLPQSR